MGRGVSFFMGSESKILVGSSAARLAPATRSLMLPERLAPAKGGSRVFRKETQHSRHRIGRFALQGKPKLPTGLPLRAVAGGPPRRKAYPPPRKPPAEQRPRASSLELSPGVEARAAKPSIVEERPELAAARRMLQLAQRLGLDLTNALARDRELLADL